MARLRLWQPTRNADAAKQHARESGNADKRGELAGPGDTNPVTSSLILSSYADRPAAPTHVGRAVEQSWRTQERHMITILVIVLVLMLLGALPS